MEYSNSRQQAIFTDWPFVGEAGIMQTTAATFTVCDTAQGGQYVQRVVVNPTTKVEEKIKLAPCHRVTLVDGYDSHGNCALYIGEDHGTHVEIMKSNMVKTHQLSYKGDHTYSDLISLFTSTVDTTPIKESTMKKQSKAVQPTVVEPTVVEPTISPKKASPKKASQPTVEAATTPVLHCIYPAPKPVLDDDEQAIRDYRNSHGLDLKTGAPIARAPKVAPKPEEPVLPPTLTPKAIASPSAEPQVTTLEPVGPITPPVPAISSEAKLILEALASGGVEALQALIDSKAVSTGRVAPARPARVATPKPPKVSSGKLGAGVKMPTNGPNAAHLAAMSAETRTSMLAAHDGGMSHVNVDLAFGYRGTTGRLSYLLFWERAHQAELAEAMTQETAVA